MPSTQTRFRIPEMHTSGGGDGGRTWESHAEGRVGEMFSEKG